MSFDNGDFWTSSTVTGPVPWTLSNSKQITMVYHWSPLSYIYTSKLYKNLTYKLCVLTRGKSLEIVQDILKVWSSQSWQDTSFKVVSSGVQCFKRHSFHVFSWQYSCDRVDFSHSFHVFSFVSHEYCPRVTVSVTLQPWNLLLTPKRDSCLQEEGRSERFTTDSWENTVKSGLYSSTEVRKRETWTY